MTAAAGITVDTAGVAPTVEVIGLSRTFPTPAGPVTALAQADLCVAGGEMVAIVGPSGAGKSTLLHLLGLLDSPTSGRYRLAGADTSELSPTDRGRLRAQAIGFVFQAFHLVGHKSATENVMLPLIYQRAPRETRRGRAIEALERIGLGQRLDAAPATMSGGEKQRVAVARALVHNPRLLLCDEPTGNLDTENSRAVIDLLRELTRQDGMATIVVTHDLEVAASADRIIRVVDGHTRLPEGGPDAA